MLFIGGKWESPMKVKGIFALIKQGLQKGRYFDTVRSKERTSVNLAMAIKELLLLGNPKLYEVCAPVKREERQSLDPFIEDLHDTLMHFRKQLGTGRAIAAPQLGIVKRFIYMNIKEPIVFINPVLDQESSEMITVWDDCMCFPDLLVKVARHQRCRITYRDMEWKECSMRLEGALSELLQHECDHLDGILAVSRAIDKFSFALKSQRNPGFS
jgi:peptide deformylase